MIDKKDEQLQENAEVKLSVTIAAPEVQRVYDVTVAEHCRTVRIKGFRKGKVPRDVLIRKVGDALLAETSERIISEAAQEALQAAEHPPIRSSSPHVKTDQSLVIGEPFEFDLLYDTKPAISLGSYREIDVMRPRFRIDDVDMERELAMIRDQNAVVVEKHSDVVESGDVVEIDYVEVNGGTPIVSTRREGFVFEVGTGYNLHRIDDDLIGMRVDESRDIDKSYADDFEEESLAGRSLVLRVRVRRLREKQLPELDDDLAQDVSDRFETLDDLKADILERMTQNGDRIVRERLISSILNAVAESSVVPLPRSLVDTGLTADWQGMVARYGGNERRVIQEIERSGTDRDTLMEQWRPDAEQRTRLLLVTDRLAEEEGVEVSDNEVEQELRRRAEERSIDVDKLREAYERNELMSSVGADLRNEKLFDRLIEIATVKDGEELSYVDLLSGKG